MRFPIDLPRSWLLLCVAAFLNPLLSPAAEQSWRPLFNGKDLSGWSVVLRNSKTNDPDHLVQVDQGAVHMYQSAPDGTPQPAGYIVTDQEFSSYHLRLEYKWGQKRFAPRNKVRRDAGILYHVIGKDGVWPKSVECQIQENDVGDIFTVNTRITGFVDAHTTNQVPVIRTNEAGVVVTNQSAPVYLPSANGGIPFVRGNAKTIQRVIRNPMNEKEGWNTVEVIVHGDQATYLVNGKLNNEAAHIQQFVNDQWIPLTRGRIALQLELAEVWYRNIEIRELAE